MVLRKRDILLEDCTDSGDYPIHIAVRTRNISIVESLFEYAEGDAGYGTEFTTSLASNDGDTPIGIALKNNDLEIVKLLLSEGSPVEAIDFNFAIEFDDEDDIPEIDLVSIDEDMRALLNNSKPN